MAFDGPTPFDGDPAYDFVHEIGCQSPARVRAALARAFKATRAEYVEVDEGVWAWCAAEPAIADGSWTILGNLPHLLERAPREPIYYHSKVFRQEDDEIGPFGSAESLDGSLRALTRVEANKLGLDDPSFQNCCEPDILVDYLSRVSRTWSR